MSTYDNTRSVSVVAGSAVTLYRFVKAAADGKFDMAAAAQGRVDGIAADAAAADGDVLPMILPGCVAKVEAGAAVTRGAIVSTDTSGRAVAQGSSNGDLGWGVALEAASDAGEVIKILFGFVGQVNA